MIQGVGGGGWVEWRQFMTDIQLVILNQILMQSHVDYIIIGMACSLLYTHWIIRIGQNLKAAGIKHYQHAEI